MIVLYVGIAVVVLLVIYFISVYNSLVRHKNDATEAFATMDVYLKKRWDIVPNLVEIVKGYAKHEKATFKEIVEIRSSAYDSMIPEEKIEANKKLTQGIGRLLALSESYPDPDRK